MSNVKTRVTTTSVNLTVDSLVWWVNVQNDSSLPIETCITKHSYTLLKVSESGKELKHFYFHQNYTF